MRLLVLALALAVVGCKGRGDVDTFAGCIGPDDPACSTGPAPVDAAFADVSVNEANDGATVDSEVGDGASDGDARNARDADAE